MIITIQHVRTVPGFGKRPGLCSRGARAWCRRHGIDWSAFLRDGIDSARLLAIGDAYALALVQHAQGGNRGR